MGLIGLKRKLINEWLLKEKQFQDKMGEEWPDYANNAEYWRLLHEMNSLLIRARKLLNDEVIE